MTLKVRVQGGKLIGEAPPGLPDGTELELVIAEPEDDLSPKDLAELKEALDAGWRCIAEGRFRPLSEAIAELRAEE